MKPISTKMHGILDYSSAAALLVLPRVLRWNKPTTNLLTGAAVTTTAYSLLTDYELGARRVLPMKAHLALDTAQSLLLTAAPFAFQSVGGQAVGIDPASCKLKYSSHKGMLVGLLAISVIEALIVLGSQTKPPSKNIFARLIRRFR